MIGEEIRKYREELGLTGSQLAARAGMAPSAVSQIETGKRTPNSASVIKLAEALGVEVGALFPKGQPPLPLESEERRPRVFDMVHELVSRQLEEDRQAMARAGESQLAQGSFVRHENEAFNRLLEYPQGDIAEAYVDLMRDWVHLGRELEQLQLRLESDRASAAEAQGVQVRNQ